MSDAGVVMLDAHGEARRLWAAALAAIGRDDLISLCEAVDLGVRAAEILAVDRLQKVKANFPATIVAQLDLPEPAIDAHRDAVSVPSTLAFAEVLDLASEEGLDCVGPHLHRGWEDRRYSCRRARTTAAEAFGFDLSGPQRESLLLLGAYRNRLFRYPPPVRVDAAAIRGAFPALVALVQQLSAAI